MSGFGVPAALRGVNLSPMLSSTTRATEALPASQRLADIHLATETLLTQGRVVLPALLGATECDAVAKLCPQADYNCLHGCDFS